MLNLLPVLTAWNTPDFKRVLSSELQQLDKSQLPL